MIELYELENEDYGKDTVEVVRCQNCIFSEGMESSQYRMCAKHFEVVPIDGYCFEARGTQCHTDV